jgi:hypothetical protein
VSNSSRIDRNDHEMSDALRHTSCRNQKNDRRGMEKRSMKPFVRILSIAAIAGSMAMLSSSRAEAGRVDGPATWLVVVPRYQTVTYDILFAAGQTAAITASGDNSTNVGLDVSDGAGTHWVGGGFANMKSVSFTVIKEGTFHVEIRNLDPVTNTFVVRTN